MKRLAAILSALILLGLFQAYGQNSEKEIIAKMTAPADTLGAGVLEAVSLMGVDDYRGAYTLLDSLSTSFPDDDAVAYYLGLCSFSLHMPAKAVECFENAVRIDPKNLTYKEALASAYVSAGEAGKAGVVYRELSGIKPKKYRNAYTQMVIADAYRMERDFDRYFEVLEEFAKDETVEPGPKYKALLSAVSNFDTKTFTSILPKVEHLADVFVAAEPKSWDAHNYRMQILYFQDKYEQVIDEAQRMFFLTEDLEEKAHMLGLIGDCWYSVGNPKNAYKYYKLALSYDPDDTSVLNNYAYYLSVDGKKLKKAAEMSRRSIEIEPDNATYLDTYGWILYLQGKYAEAKPHFKHAMLYGGKESATILAHYSAVLEALGETDLAKYYKTLSENR